MTYSTVIFFQDANKKGKKMKWEWNLRWIKNVKLVGKRKTWNGWNLGKTTNVKLMKFKESKKREINGIWDEQRNVELVKLEGR